VIDEKSFLEFFEGEFGFNFVDAESGRRILDIIAERERQNDGDVHPDKDKDELVLTDKDKEFFGGIAGELKRLGEIAYLEYQPLARAVIEGEIGNEREIDLLLDRMLDFCYSEKVYSLYKEVVHNTAKRYLPVAISHVYAFFEMYDPEVVGLSEDGDYSIKEMGEARQRVEEKLTRLVGTEGFSFDNPKHDLFVAVELFVVLDRDGKEPVLVSS